MIWGLISEFGRLNPSPTLHTPLAAMDDDAGKCPEKPEKNAFQNAGTLNLWGTCSVEQSEHC